MKFRARAQIEPDAWNAFVERHPHGWFWHTSHWIDYSLAYTPGATDRSYALLDDEGLVRGVVPLVLDPRWARLVHGGQITPAPLFDFAIFNRSVANAASEHSAALLGGATPLPMQLHPSVEPLGRPPNTVRVDRGATYVVDLREDEARIWQRIRKSYKALIHRTERDYDIGVFRAPWAALVAHTIHREASGHETRPDRTWALMEDWTTLGHAFVVLASRKGPLAYEVWPGADAYAYVICYKRWSYYASGAANKVDTHAVQWAAIKALKQSGGTFYELGHAARPQDTEKDRGVALFKSGFGGGTRPWIVVHDRVH
jgi:hypothetical protein